MSHAEYSDILYIGFNQDNSCVQGATNSGFFMFNTEPFSKGVWRSFTNGGVAIVELLYKSNIVALVGGGFCPQFPVNKVMMWNDSESKCVGELTFPNPVMAVRMRKDMVAVALEKRIYIHNFSTLQVLYSFDTNSNTKGLCALSLEPQNRVLAYPGLERGVIKIEHLSGDQSRETVTISAHETELSALVVNRTGTLVASSSERGTLIRIFDTKTGRLMHQLRRGADQATIYSLCFDEASKLFACSSDKNTVHIFSLEGRGANESDASASSTTDSSAKSQAGAGTETPKPQSPHRLSVTEQAKEMFKDFLPGYFTEEAQRSVVRFQVQEARTVCAFGLKPNTIYVAGHDGNFSQFEFDTTSGAFERTMYGSVLAST